MDTRNGATTSPSGSTPLSSNPTASEQKSSRTTAEILMDESPLVVVKSEEERQVWEDRFRRADEKAARMLAMLEQKNNTR